MSSDKLVTDPTPAPPLEGRGKREEAFSASFIGWGVLLDRMGGLGLPGGGSLKFAVSKLGVYPTQTLGLP